MVRASYDALFACIYPVFVKFRVFQPGAFGGFDKSEGDFHVADFHLFHPRPVDPLLPFAHVDAVHRVAVGNPDAELFVLLVMQRILDQRAQFVAKLGTGDEGDQKDKQQRSSQFPGVTFAHGVIGRENAEFLEPAGHERLLVIGY